MGEVELPNGLRGDAKKWTTTRNREIATTWNLSKLSHIIQGAMDIFANRNEIALHFFLPGGR